MKKQSTQMIDSTRTFRNVPELCFTTNNDDFSMHKSTSSKLLHEQLSRKNPFDKSGKTHTTQTNRKVVSRYWC